MIKLVRLRYDLVKPQTDSVYVFRTQTTFRNERAEYAEHSRIASELDFLWSQGYRGILAFGQNVYGFLNFSGSFKDNRGTFFDLPLYLNPQDRPWVVIPTIDPVSKSAYIRNGYEIYKADLAKLLGRIENGSSELHKNYLASASVQEILNWFAAHSNVQTVACDIETDSLVPGEVVCISIATSPTEALCVYWRRGRGVSWYSGTDEVRVRDALVNFLNTRTTVWHHGTEFDIPYMIRCGFSLNIFADIQDTLRIHKLLDPESPHSLAHLASVYCNRSFWKSEFRNRGCSIYAFDPLKLALYNCDDACITLECYNAMSGGSSHRDLMIPLTIRKCLSDFKVNSETIDSQLKSKIAILESELRKIGNLPPTFNFNSITHLNAFVFNIRRLKKELDIVERNTQVATQLQQRLEQFEQEHKGWSEARVARERERFVRLIATKTSTATFIQAKQTIEFYSSLCSLYDFKRLQYSPKITALGLYSFDDIARKALAHALERQKAHFESLKTPKSTAEIDKLLQWLALFEQRSLLLSTTDILSLPLEILRTFDISAKTGNVFARFAIAGNELDLASKPWPIVLITSSWVLFECPLKNCPKESFKTLKEALE